MDILLCLIRLDYKAVVWGNSYEGIKPHELETKPIPSLAELEAVWPQIEAEQIAEQSAKETAQLAKAQEIIDNLPDWQQVSNAIDSATTIAALKVITKKLARVVYIHLRE